MKKQGKVNSIKRTKNHMFFVVEDEKRNLVQFVVKSDNIDESFLSINVGDVLECNVEVDINNNSRYKFPNESFLINDIKVISKHIENLKFYPCIYGIKKYSLIKSRTRNLLDLLGYTEVTLPNITDDEVSSKSKSFKIRHNYIDFDLFLRKTMDAHLRILSCCGMDKIYSIGNIYRNEHITSLRQPESEMLSIFTNYSDKEEMIKLSLNILENLGYLNDKRVVNLSYQNEDQEFENEVIKIISNYPISIDSNAKCEVLKNISSEFKIKYKDKTIIHGVDEICNIDEYINMLERQGKLTSKGDLEILKNCIASGAVPCYNLGISLQRMIILFEDLSLKDITPFPFSRIKKLKP